MNRRIIIYLSTAAVLATLCSCMGNTQSDSTTAVQQVVQEKITADEPEIPETLFRPVENSLTKSGKVKPSNYTDITFRTQEQIANIYIKNGERVSKGKILAELQMHSFESQLKEIELALEQATLELKDILIGQGFNPDNLDSVPSEMMKLAKVKSGYQQALLQKEKVLHEMENATLRAPFNGIIANLTAKPGHIANTVEPLCRIIQENNMEVEFNVLENELHMVKKGQKVEITPQASTLGTLEGEIFEINPVVDKNGLIMVKARVTGNSGLMEGMNAEVLVKP